MRSRLVITAAVITVTAISCSRDPQKLKRQYVQSGDKYAAAKKYSEAIIEYRKAVAQDARFGEARYKLGLAYEATGDGRNALAEHVRAADLMPGNVDAQLHAGRMLLAARQYPEAKARANAALRREPKNVNALILLGNSMAGLKDFDGAIAQIEQAIDQDPHRTLTYANLGLLQVAKGNRTTAEAALKHAVDIEPNSASAHLSLGNFYWAGGDRIKAEAELKTAFAIAPKSADVNKVLATFYLSAGNGGEAESYLKTYADVTGDVPSKIILADFYAESKRTDEAVGLLTAISELKTGFAPAKLRLAAIRFQTGQTTQAYQTLEEILKRDPKDEAALEEKARFLLHDHKNEEALKIVSSVVDGNPQALASHYLRGLALEALGRTEDSIKAFQQLLQIDSTATPAQVKLAELYLARGDANAAADFLSRIVKTQPTGATQFLLARALLQLGDTSRAETELTSLAKANPSSPDIEMALGDLYWTKKDLTHARQSYTRALERAPQSTPLLGRLVSLDLAEKRTDAARARVEERLKESPNDAGVLLLAGNTFSTLGDLPRATSSLEKALAVDPTNIDAYNRLGALFMQQHRLDEALKDYQEAARRRPQTAVPATTMVGIILGLEGKRDEARKQFERVLALDPRAAVAANNLAWDYAERDANLDQALTLAQTAKAQLPNNAEVSDTLGWIYYKKGLVGPALTALQEATKQSPSNALLHYHLGLAYLKSGNKIEGQRSLERALKLNPTFEGAEDAKRALTPTTE